MEFNLLANIFNQLPGYIGWKDIHFNHLGCNRNLANVLSFKKTEAIIGLKDSDLIDHTTESDLFHHENDLMVLQGKIIQGIHQAAGPYSNLLFHFVKKPLYDANNNISGIIYHCNEFTPSKDHLKLNLLLSTSSHYRSELLDNKFKLSNRELDALLSSWYIF